jgi:hypothetical protein
MPLRFFVCTVIGACLLASPAAAQQTRSEQLEQMRAQRARVVQPEKHTKLEGALLYLDRTRLLQRIFAPEEGFYPQIGSITTSGGFALGAGYRHYFVNDQLLFNINGAWSLKGYRAARVELSLPRLAGETIEIRARFRYRYFPQEDYYGLGAESQKAERTDYLIEENEYALQAFWRPRPWLTVAGSAALLTPNIAGGTDPRQPTIETLFDDTTAPGLAAQPDFLETGGLFEIDYRDSNGNPRSGGRYVVFTAKYNDRDDLGFDYRRVAGQLEQYFPIFDKKRVFAFRLAANHLEAADGSRVPFYYIATIGGKDTIRGFNDLRFRDNNAWLFNAEYRWEAFSGLDMALFYDVGNVAPEFSKLSLRDAKDSYGFGFRFGTNDAILIRADVGFGSGEGTRYFVAFSGPLRLERFLR